MLHEFKNLSDVSKREFVLKYYPLILRSQQKKERLSKENFDEIFSSKRGEHAGKLLISKPAYKRYLRLIKYIGISRYDYIDDVIKNEDVIKTRMVPIQCLWVIILCLIILCLM